MPYLRTIVISALLAAASAASAQKPVSSVDEEIVCIALNLYHEARNEGDLGMLAVGQVTRNRVRHSAYPNTYCEVVFQKARRGSRMIGQFSWTTDGKPGIPRESAAWHRAVELAMVVHFQDFETGVGPALHYHADYVSPSWARSMRKIRKIGRHIFYLSDQSFRS